VSILLWVLQLTVWEAMILADFMEDEAITKSMQRKVAQSMPMKAKKASLTTANASISVSFGPPINAFILDENGVFSNNEAGCNKDKSAEKEGQMMAPDPPPLQER
jgi:hypothetical protein